MSLKRKKTARRTKRTTFTKDELEDGRFGDREEGITGIGVSTEEWLEMQERCFTKWVNHQLRNTEFIVEDLVEDIKTGNVLCELISALSEKKIRYSKTARMRIQWLNNVTAALKGIKEDLKIDLVNIGSSNIVDGDFELVMGMVWALIDNCSITLNRNELLEWVQHMIGAKTSYNVDITNFNDDFRDGKALCYLIHAIDPLAIDLTNVEENAPLANAIDAIEAACTMGIPDLIDPEDVVQTQMGEQIMTMYLSAFHTKFPQAFDPTPKEFYDGLVVEVTGGPKSDFNFLEGKENHREMTYTPTSQTQWGTFSINILWKGKMITPQPLTVTTGVRQKTLIRKKSRANQFDEKMSSRKASFASRASMMSMRSSLGSDNGDDNEETNAVGEQQPKGHMI